MIMSSYFNVFAPKNDKDLCWYHPKPHFARGVSKLLEGSVCVSCSLTFLLVFPLTPLYCSFRLICEYGACTNIRGGIYRMNQSQPIITSHIQSYRKALPPLMWLSPIHSQLPPTKPTVCFRGLLKLNGLRGGELCTVVSIELAGMLTSQLWQGFAIKSYYVSVCWNL